MLSEPANTRLAPAWACFTVRQCPPRFRWIATAPAPAALRQRPVGALSLLQHPPQAPDVRGRDVVGVSSVARRGADVDRVVGEDVEVRRVLAGRLAQAAALQTQGAAPEADGLEPVAA